MVWYLHHSIGFLVQHVPSGQRICQPFTAVELGDFRASKTAFPGNPKVWAACKEESFGAQVWLISRRRKGIPRTPCRDRQIITLAADEKDSVHGFVAVIRAILTAQILLSVVHTAS